MFADVAELVADERARPFGDLDIITEDAVVSDPESFDSGLLPFALLEGEKVFLAVILNGPKLVKFRVIAGLNRAAVAGVKGGVRRDRFLDRALQVATTLALVLESEKPRDLHFPKQIANSRKRGERALKLQEVARSRRLVGKSAGDPLEVIYLVERVF